MWGMNKPCFEQTLFCLCMSSSWHRIPGSGWSWECMSMSMDLFDGISMKHYIGILWHFMIFQVAFPAPFSPFEESTHFCFWTSLLPGQMRTSWGLGLRLVWCPQTCPQAPNDDAFIWWLGWKSRTGGKRLDNKPSIHFSLAVPLSTRFKK